MGCARIKIIDKEDSNGGTENAKILVDRFIEDDWTSKKDRDKLG